MCKHVQECDQDCPVIFKSAMEGITKRGMKTKCDRINALEVPVQLGHLEEVSWRYKNNNQTMKNMKLDSK